MSKMKYLKNIGYGVLILCVSALIFELWGWRGIIICAIVCAGVCVVLVAFISLFIYGFRSVFVYNNKEIDQTIKGFLGYDFGEEYDVLLNETRVHGDRPVHFRIKISKDAMEGVVDYCDNTRAGKRTSEGYEKTVEYKCGEYVERRESLVVNYKDCTMDFYGLSC